MERDRDGGTQEIAYVQTDPLEYKDMKEGSVCVCVSRCVYVYVCMCVLMFECMHKGECFVF